MRHNFERVTYGKGGSAPPSLAAALVGCSNVAQLRSLSPLPRDTTTQFDRAVVSVGLERLVLIDDLISAGLVYRLADPLSVMNLEWETQARTGHAQRTMLPNVQEERQMPKRTPKVLPIYITMDGFSFNLRVLRASQRIGAGLDTSSVAQATRNVNEGLEDAAINGFTDGSGAAAAVNGHSAPGLLNEANVNTFAYKDGEAWTAAGHSGEDILDDVLGMIDDAQADGYYGPYNLYVPTTYGSKLNNDFKSATSGTILERLMAIEAGGRKLNIRTADKMPANRTALVQMTSNVIDVVLGQTPTALSWEPPSGFEYHGVVMAIIVPRIKSDEEGKSGIVVGNLT